VPSVRGVECGALRRLALLMVLCTVVGLIVPASSLAASSAASALERDCNHVAGDNLRIISTRNMRRRAAQRVMRRNDTPIDRHFDAPNGFRCNLKEGRLISGISRCTREEKAFRFALRRLERSGPKPPSVDLVTS
jgi:hypothetical protein